MRNLIISSSLLALVACAGSEREAAVADATPTPAAQTAEPQSVDTAAAAATAPPALSPEESLKKLHVREGFKAELIACEPVVLEVESGLHVATWHGYCPPDEFSVASTW